MLVVRFLVVVEPVAGFFDEVDFAAVLVLAFDVGLLTVFTGVLLAVAGVLLTVFVLVLLVLVLLVLVLLGLALLGLALVAADFVGVAIASRRGFGFAAGMLART